jgi:Fe-S cluster biogenesis protein NfuA
MKILKVSEQTYSFTFEKPISTDEFFISNSQQSVNSPIAKKLFGFPWTEAIKVSPMSLELTKKDWVDWDILLEPLQGLLEEHFASTTVLEKSPVLKTSTLDTDEASAIKNFIEQNINPSLAAHGGWIELKSFDSQTAYLHMGGGCQGCASSQATMVDGVETALKSQFPFVQRVVDVTDHSLGENPYL